jgi:hypothetical protein
LEETHGKEKKFGFKGFDYQSGAIAKMVGEGSWCSRNNTKFNHQWEIHTG